MGLWCPTLTLANCPTNCIAQYFLKYVMSMVDVHMEGRWESKSTYVFYLELVTDLLHLFVYCVFFLLVFSNYGLPLHLVRELYSTFNNFRTRIVDFLRFRQVGLVCRPRPSSLPPDPVT